MSHTRFNWAKTIQELDCWELQRRKWAAENHLEVGPTLTVPVMLVPIRRNNHTWNMDTWAVSLADYHTCRSKNPRYQRAIKGWQRVMTFNR